MWRHFFARSNFCSSRFWEFGVKRNGVGQWPPSPVWRRFPYLLPNLVDKKYFSEIFCRGLLVYFPENTENHSTYTRGRMYPKIPSLGPDGTKNGKIPKRYKTRRRETKKTEQTSRFPPDLFCDRTAKRKASRVVFRTSSFRVWENQLAGCPSTVSIFHRFFIYCVPREKSQESNWEKEGSGKKGQFLPSPFPGKNYLISK